MDGQLRVYIGADTAQFKKQIKSAQNSLNLFTKISVDAGAAIRKTFVNAFAVTSAYDFFNNLITVGRDFENQMARVTAVCNATTQQYKMMRDEAERLGATTKYTAREAAAALENLTRNGLDARKATKALSSVLELAGANAIELADAADIATNTMNMFQLEVLELNKVNDVLSATCASSATNIIDLYEAMKYAGSTANLFGISIEETSAALGVLANMGIKGSLAGTALRSMLLRLASPTSEAQAVLEKYGLEINETTIKMDGLVKTIEKLYNSGIGNSVADSATLFGKLFGGTNVALINSFDLLLSMSSITQSSEGTAARMFRQGIGEFKKAADSFSSNLESAMIQLFNNIKPIGVWLLNTMNDVVSMAKSIGFWVGNAAIIGFGKATQYGTEMSRQAKNIQKYSLDAVNVFKTLAESNSGSWGIDNESITVLKSIKEEYQNISLLALKAGVTMTDVNNSVLVLRKAINAANKGKSGEFLGYLSELQTLYNEIKIAANDATPVQTKLWNTIKNGAKTAGKQLVNFFGGWWNIAITGAMIAFNSVYNAYMKNNAAMREYKNILQEVSDNNARLDNSLKSTVESLRGMTKESGAWKATVAYIKREYPELVDKLKLEEIHVNASAEAWAKYSEELNKAVEEQKKFNLADAALKSIDTLSADLFEKRFSSIFKKARANSSEVEKVQLSQAESELISLIKTGTATVLDFKNIFSKYNIKDISEVSGYGNINNVDQLIGFLVGSEIYKELAELNKLLDKQDTPKLGIEELNKDLELFKQRFDAAKTAIEEEGRVAGKELSSIDSEIRSLAENFVNEIINKYKSVEIDGLKGLDLINANASFLKLRFAAATSSSNTVYPDGSLAKLEQLISKKKAELDLAINDEDRIRINKELEELTELKRVIEFKYKYPKAPDSKFKKVSLAEKMPEMKSINITEGWDIGEKTKELGEYTNALTAAADAIRAFTATKFESDGQGWTMWSASVVSSIATALPAIESAAIALGILEGAKVPFPANIAAIATVVALITSMFASIPAFATGGIVGGNSTVGDHNLVRVNSGEMILNNRQLRNLFNLLNGNGNISSGSGQVEFKIKGKELVGVLNNYNNKMNKVR